jgi:hypothetical protein
MYPARFDFDVRTAAAQLRLTGTGSRPPALHARFVYLAVQCRYPGSGDGGSASSVRKRQDAYTLPVEAPVVPRRQRTEPGQRPGPD